MTDWHPHAVYIYMYTDSEVLTFYILFLSMHSVVLSMYVIVRVSHLSVGILAIYQCLSTYSKICRIVVMMMS